MILIQIHRSRPIKKKKTLSIDFLKKLRSLYLTEFKKRAKSWGISFASDGQCREGKTTLL